MLIPSSACVALIKKFEGCRLTAYPDPGTGGEPFTIGFGATGRDIHKGLVWKQVQADTRLLDDIAKFAVGVQSAIGKAKTTQGQFDSMTSLAFNIGLSNFRASTLLRRHMAGEKAEAADQFARWTRSGGRILPGLVRRRAAEAALYRGNPL